MYPEYTGVILSVLAMQTRRPASEDAAYASAQKFEKAGATPSWTRRRSSTLTRWPR